MPQTPLRNQWNQQLTRLAAELGSKSSGRQYRFGRNVLLGEGAEFRLLLKAFHEGKVYYDPGIKLEGISTGRPKAKKRSQFRVASKHLPALYLTSRMVDACKEAGC